MDNEKKISAPSRALSIAAIVAAAGACCAVGLNADFKPILRIVVICLILGFALTYAIYILKTKGQSPKGLAGFSITYHIVSCALLVFGFIVLIAILPWVALGNNNNGSSSSGSSGSSSSGSGSDDPYGALFMCFNIFGIIFMLFGIVRAIFEFLYIKDHVKYGKAYKAMMGVYAGLSILPPLFLGIIFLALKSVALGIGVLSLGLTFALLFLSSDFAFLEGPEMQVSLENGVTPKDDDDDDYR